MKKVGLITICDYGNYGNRLQNYATQEVLKSLGHEVETIVNTPPEASQAAKGITSKMNRLRGLTASEVFDKRNRQERSCEVS